MNLNFFFLEVVFVNPMFEMFILHGFPQSL